LSCGISKADFEEEALIIKEESEWANVFHGESF
jgi:hypothetical protein